MTKAKGEKGRKERKAVGVGNGEREGRARHRERHKEGGGQVIMGKGFSTLFSKKENRQ